MIRSFSGNYMEHWCKKIIYKRKAALLQKENYTYRLTETEHPNQAHQSYSRYWLDILTDFCSKSYCIWPPYMNEAGGRCIETFCQHHPCDWWPVLGEKIPVYLSLIESFNSYSMKSEVPVHIHTKIIEAAAIIFKTFRSITRQEYTWTTRNKDSTQIYTGWTFTCANFTYNNLALHQINIKLNTHFTH